MTGSTGQKFLKAISAPGKDTVNRLVLRKAGVYDLSKKGQQVKATQILKSVHKGDDKIHGLSEQKSKHLLEREGHLVKYLHGRAVRSDVTHESAHQAVHEFHVEEREARAEEEKKKFDAASEEKEEEEKEERMEANRKALRAKREIADERGGGDQTSALRQSRAQETSSAVRAANRGARSSAAQVADARTSALGPKPKKPKEMMI